jgi:hypothetical protein
MHHHANCRHQVPSRIAARAVFKNELVFIVKILLYRTLDRLEIGRKLGERKKTAQ